MRALYAIVGFLLALCWVFTWQPIPTPTYPAELLHTLKTQIARDNRILNIFMDGQFDRNKCYYRDPQYQLADGQWVFHMYKVDCNDY